MKRNSIAHQIHQKRRQLRAAKPRSELAAKLYFELRRLLTKQLQVENRLDRKLAV